MKHLFTLLLAVTLFAACKKDDPIVPIVITPTLVGSWWDSVATHRVLTFTADSIHYTNSNGQPSGIASDRYYTSGDTIFYLDPSAAHPLFRYHISKANDTLSLQSFVSGAHGLTYTRIN